MSTLPSGLPSLVEDGEPLARFMTSSSHFNSSGVRSVAFLLNPKDGNTSVFRHGRTPEQHLWDIGDQIVQASSRRVHGAAFLRAADVRAAELEVLSDEPPDRHANISDWPCYRSDPALEKAARKEIALILTQSATTVMRP